MSHTVAIAVLSIAVAGVAAQWVAWRLKLPAIVLLFAVGLIIGPGLQLLTPANDLPGLRPVVSLAVAIVLFEGGLGLDFRELRAAGEGVFRLTMVALPISFVLAALAANHIGGMGWRSSLLYGAITVVTGPTVVLPLLRHTRLERRTASFLKWEAIVNDPIGALLAAMVLSLMLANADRGAAEIALWLAGGLAVATALAIGSAYLVRWLFTHDLTSESLKTPILLAMTMGIYVVSNLVTDEAGLAAATIFGIALANMHIPGIGEITRFKESLAVLLVSALFVVLTASLDRSLFTQISWPVIGLTLTMIFVVRPSAIWLATARSNLTWQERALAGWIAPRGIVAAAVAGVAAQKLAGAGFPGSQLVMPAVFALIATTMIFHGFSLAPLAKRLRLTLGDRPGLAILGATPWSIELAKTLHDAGAPILLIDAYPDALKDARKNGVPVLRAEILSERGEEKVAERRVDYLLTATRNDVYNSLICAKLAPELGRGRVFQLAPGAEELDAWIAMKRDWRGILVGRPPLDFATIRKHRKDGWRFVLGDPIEEPVNAGNNDDRAPADSAQNLPETEILVLRKNGDFTFYSPETGEVILATGDRRLVFKVPDDTVELGRTAVDAAVG